MGHDPSSIRFLIYCIIAVMRKADLLTDQFPFTHFAQWPYAQLSGQSKYGQEPSCINIYTNNIEYYLIDILEVFLRVKKVRYI